VVEGEQEIDGDYIRKSMQINGGAEWLYKK
jgi:hypothetical protein